MSNKMDTQPNFDFLCRVCAVNTKVRNSVAECVYILKTPSLKDKIEKYLYLKIADDDLLPKVLCKTCFRQVEATATLSKIGHHTQQVFRDSLFTSKPQPQPHQRRNYTDINHQYDHNHFNTDINEFRPLMLTTKPRQVELERTIIPPPETTITPAPVHVPPPPTPQPPQQQPIALTVAQRPAPLPPLPSLPPPPPPVTQLIQHRKDEVVVNVSISDPLTRETRQKMIDNAAMQRRHSIVGSYTPKSIAQRAFATPAPVQSAQLNVPTSSVNKTPPNKIVENNNSSSIKKVSPAGVIDFMQSHGAIVSNNNNNSNNHSSNNHTSNNHNSNNQNINNYNSNINNSNINNSNINNSNINTSNICKSVSNMGILNMPTSVIQQKRKNLKMVTNNIKAVNTGQVSLLKSSQNRAKQQQQRKAEQEQQFERKSPLTITKIATKSVLDGDLTEESLPEHIIIAVPKSLKKATSPAKPTKIDLPPTQSSKVEPATVQPSVKLDEATIVEENAQKAKQQQQQPENSEQKQKQQEQTEQQEQKQPQQLKLKQSQRQKLQKQQQLEFQKQQLELELQKQQLEIQNQQLELQKQRKQKQQQLQKQQQEVQKQQQQQQRKQQQQSNESRESTPSSLTEDILLGKVIRDPDLLKLILKALQWPVSKTNFDAQMIRLKNSKFADIMSDRNLLQDTDLTQLLGPYLAPVLLAAQALQQQQQQQQLATDEAATQSAASAAELQQAKDLASSIPYKLPPETSVQLVPASPTEQEDSDIAIPINEPMKAASEQKTLKASRRQQRKIRERQNSILLTDDFEASTHSRRRSSSKSSASSSSIPQIDFSALFMMPQSLQRSGAGEFGNEAIYELLQKNINRMQQRKRRRSSASLVASNTVDLEDIVLIEPQPHVPTNYITEAEPSVSNISFKIPQPQTLPDPIITRPIIKRRKTVILGAKANQSSTSNTTTNTNNEKEKAPVVIETKTPSDECVAETTNTTLITPSQAQQTTPPTTKSPSRTVHETNKITEPTKSSDISLNKIATSKKSNNSKSALGQQLLEAIGLQKIGGCDENGAQILSEASPRDSIQQIRSALKRSLKQAQEQQQQRSSKQEEPIKQVADSTTKSMLRDVVDLDDVVEVGQKQRKPDTEQGSIKPRTKKTLSFSMDKVNEQTSTTAELELKSEKDNKSEQHNSNVSSSDMTPRKRGRKRKEDKEAEPQQKQNDEDSVGDTNDEKLNDRWDDDDDVPLKVELLNRSSSRPTRASKTLSKYYKGPGKTTSRSISTRATRQR